MEFTTKDNIVLASLGQRALNFIIDIILISQISFFCYSRIANVPLDVEKLYEDPNLQIMIYVCIVIYYFVCELFLGRTLGKFFTKTTVVNLYGDKPQIKEILIRTLCRLIPLYYLSAFLPYILGKYFQAPIHDMLSKTRVVDIQSNI